MTVLKDVAKTLVKRLLLRGTFRSYSQFGEDAYLNALFRHQRKGFYVDVGCYHPHLYSNTYALYRRGWHGICVDPNATLARLYGIFRPRDTFVQAGIGIGTGRYQTSSDPAMNKFTDGSTPLVPLSRLINEHHVTHIDLLNVDTEGRDLAVLQSHDWRIKPTVIAVEAAPSGEVQRFLENHGYALKGMLGLTLVFRLAR